MVRVVPRQNREFLRELCKPENERRYKFDEKDIKWLTRATPLVPADIERNKGWWDIRHQRIFSFLWRKGYVEDHLWLPRTFRKKISLADWLWVCENVDDRMYQLIPAVLIRFPTHFKTAPKSPADIEHLVKVLKSGATKGPSFHDYPFRLLHSWLEFEPLDRRAHKAEGSQLSMRLSPTATRHLDQYTATLRITRTEAIHRAIEKLEV